MGRANTPETLCDTRDSVVRFAFDSARKFSPNVGYKKLALVSCDCDQAYIEDMREIWRWAHDEAVRILPFVEKKFHAVSLSELADMAEFSQKENFTRMVQYACALAVTMQQCRKWEAIMAGENVVAFGPVN